MSNRSPTSPRKNDPRFIAFCEYLRKALVRPAGGLAVCSYPDHFIVLDVRVEVQPDYDVSYCWYNCLDHMLTSGGQVIYGWLLWQHADKFIAQHHAVWRSEQGELLDPTPNEASAANVLFMPDNRAPFDIDQLRSPPNLVWQANGDFMWVAGEIRSASFFIARMSATMAEVDRIERTRQRLAERLQMVSTVQQAMANILFNKLMQSFDDLEALSAIQVSKEFRILVDLQELLGKTKIPADTPGCVDYDLVIGAWNRLQTEVGALNERNEALVEMLIERYQVNTPDPFLLLGSLIHHDTKIIQKLDEASRKTFKEYVSEGNKIIRDFRTTLLDYHGADMVDRFLDNSHIIDQKNIDYKPIDLSGKVFYLDLNVISRVMDHPQWMRQCKASQESKAIALVCSAYLVEDSINMDPLFLNDFLDDLSTFTGNQMIGFIDDEPCFVSEDILRTAERALHYAGLTKNFEKHRFINVIRHYHDHPELRKGKKLYNELVKGPIDFFRRQTKADIPGFELVTRKFSDRQLVTDFITTGSIRDTSLQEKGQLIEDLLELFDFINFETEAVKLANAGKISSSYRDNKHLAHACIADYVVTEDKRMRARGNFIYELIGVRTKVIDLKAFVELLPSLPKNRAEPAV